MTQTTFGNVFAAWISYDENDQLSVTSNLDDLCSHFGTTKGEFLNEVYQRSGAEVRI